MIAAVDQIVHGVDDREAGTHIGLKEELHIATASRIFEQTVVIVSRGRGYFVGSNDRDVLVEERFVDSSHILVRGTVYKDGIEDVHLQNFVSQLSGRRRHALGLELFHGGVGIQALATEQHLPRVGHADNVEP